MRAVGMTRRDKLCFRGDRFAGALLASSLCTVNCLAQDGSNVPPSRQMQDLDEGKSGPPAPAIEVKERTAHIGLSYLGYELRPPELWLILGIQNFPDSGCTLEAEPGSLLLAQDGLEYPAVRPELGRLPPGAQSPQSRLAYELSGPPAEDAKLMLRGLQCGGRPLSTVELPLGSPRPYLPPPSDPEAVQAIPLGEP